MSVVNLVNSLFKSQRTFSMTTETSYTLPIISLFPPWANSTPPAPDLNLLPQPQKMIIIYILFRKQMHNLFIIKGHPAIDGPEKLHTLLAIYNIEFRFIIAHINDQCRRKVPGIFF